MQSCFGIYTSDGFKIDNILSLKLCGIYMGTFLKNNLWKIFEIEGKSDIMQKITKEVIL